MLKILCQEETYVYNAYHMGKAFYPSEPVEASAEEKASHYVVLYLPSGKVLALDEEPGEKEEKSIRKRRMDRKLYQALAERCPQEELFLLSTDLCPAHRTQVIQTIRQRQREKLPCKFNSSFL